MEQIDEGIKVRVVVAFHSRVGVKCPQQVHRRRLINVNWPFKLLGNQVGFSSVFAISWKHIQFLGFHLLDSFADLVVIPAEKELTLGVDRPVS